MYFGHKRRATFTTITSIPRSGTTSRSVMGTSSWHPTPKPARRGPKRLSGSCTALGEHRPIGCRSSLITLDAQSQVAVQCTRNLLRAHVLQGGASFRDAGGYSHAASIFSNRFRAISITATLSSAHSHSALTGTHRDPPSSVRP